MKARSKHCGLSACASANSKLRLAAMLRDSESLLARSRLQADSYRSQRCVSLSHSSLSLHELSALLCTLCCTRAGRHGCGGSTLNNSSGNEVSAHYATLQSLVNLYRGMLRAVELISCVEPWQMFMKLQEPRSSYVQTTQVIVALMCPRLTRFVQHFSTLLHRSETSREDSGGGLRF